MWNPLLELFCHIQIGLCVETPVDEVLHSQGCISLATLQKRLPWKLSLSDTFVAAQFVPAQTFSVDELFDTLLALHWWEKVTVQPSVYVFRPCSKTVSTEGMQTSTASSWASLKHCLRLLHEYHF